MRILPAKLGEPFLQYSGADAAGYVIGPLRNRIVKRQIALRPGEHCLAVGLPDLRRLADSPDDAGTGCRAHPQYCKLTWHIESICQSSWRHADEYADCKGDETSRSD